MHELGMAARVVDVAVARASAAGPERITDVHLEIGAESGLSMAGTTPVLIFVTASAGSLQVAVETKTVGSFYTAKGAGLTTLAPDGATVAGDVSESVKAGATPMSST